MLTLANIQLANTDIRIHISMCMLTRVIHIFKHDNHSCNYDVFWDQEEACAFLARPIVKY
jgi:hypothetical protein